MKLLPSLCFAIFSSLLVSCDRQPADAPSSALGKDGWLRGTTDEKLDTVANHLRGNDVVMWEVGHRHRELYRAITSENREYAAYQFEKTILAMKMGVERRPARTSSYESFFSAVEEPMMKALKNGDKASQIAAYQLMTSHCAACHATEKVAWIPVDRPWENSSHP